MKKQSIENRKYLDKMSKEDPQRFELVKHRRRYASAKSFIRIHATLEDTKNLKEVIKTREAQLKKEASNETSKK